ncbi:MAG: sulfatase-like hydrolase/transferase, partial [Planctomycetota bacterium]
MNFKHIISIILFQLCATSLLATELQRPNLLLIYCDDLGWGDVSFNGHPIVDTPNIDSLAAQGMIFDHNYAGATHCSPSRVTLMLGKASYRVGFYDIVGRGDMDLPRDEKTIAELLRDSGYQTFHGAKWHMSAHSKGREDAPLEHGFDVTTDPGMATNVVKEFGEWLKPADSAESPFFAYLAFHESHMPVEKWSPEPFREKFRPVDESAFRSI